jgi:hypothetical protein
MSLSATIIDLVLELFKTDGAAVVVTGKRGCGAAEMVDDGCMM